MIASLVFGLPGQMAALVFCSWFVRGVWCAMMRPRLRYITHSKAPVRDGLQHGDMFIEVFRQQRLPPFLLRRESWLVRSDATAHRESDGYTVGRGNEFNHLWVRLEALRVTCEARDAELETYEATK